jgi:hypothetical protein
MTVKYMKILKIVLRDGKNPPLVFNKDTKSGQGVSQ